MIYAEHSWKVNRAGRPLGKHFTESQWDATRPVKVRHNGEVVVFENSGWVMTETGEAPVEPKPLKKTPQVKSEAKAKTTTKKKAPAKRKKAAPKSETKKE